jgi:hypothetical protein
MLDDTTGSDLDFGHLRRVGGVAGAARKPGPGVSHARSAPQPRFALQVSPGRGRRGPARRLSWSASRSRWTPLRLRADSRGPITPHPGPTPPRALPPQNISIVAIDELAWWAGGPGPGAHRRDHRRLPGGAEVIALDILMNRPDENSRLVLARTLADVTGARFPGPGPAAEFGRSRGRPGGRRHHAALTDPADTRRLVLLLVFEHE